MRIMPLALMFLISLGCVATPHRVDLTQIKFNHTQPTSSCMVDYHIILNTSSREYEVTTIPKGYLMSKQPFIFPVGRLVQSALERAQNGAGGEEIPIHLFMSQFDIIFAGGWVGNLWVDRLTYQAQFFGADPVGLISVNETIQVSIHEHWETEDRFYAVNKASRSMTLKLLAEANKRLCGISTNGHSINTN